MIVDSSTLILMAKTGFLDLILKNKKLRITKKVMEESTKAKESFDTRLIDQRIKENKIEVVEIKNFNLYNKLIKEFSLGKSEAEALTLAFEENKRVLTDDKKAINTCKILNIKFTTALNILVKLSQEKTIKREIIKTIFKKLKNFGRYSNEIIKIAEEDLK